MDDMEALASRKTAVPNAPPLDLEQVFREHHTMVFRAAYRVTGNAEDAEDVLQTVFMRLTRRDEASEAVGHLSGYLRRAAVNAAFDLLRGRQRANQTPLEDLEPILSDESMHGPERVYHSKEVREWLRATVARLSPMAAEVFALRFFEEKSIAEIAQAVGTSMGAVSVTLSRARDRVEREFHVYWRTQS